MRAVRTTTSTPASRTADRNWLPDRKHSSELQQLKQEGGLDEALLRPRHRDCRLGGAKSEPQMEPPMNPMSILTLPASTLREAYFHLGAPASCGEYTERRSALIACLLSQGHCCSPWSDARMSGVRDSEPQTGTSITLRWQQVQVDQQPFGHLLFNPGIHRARAGAFTSRVVRPSPGDQVWALRDRARLRREPQASRARTTLSGQTRRATDTGRGPRRDR